jgi:hypothetical protein
LNFPSAIKPKIPELDLAFALTATSGDGEEMYKLMKSTIKSIITNYGDDKIQYGLIHYGEFAATKITFGDTFPSTDKLKAYIDALPRYTGGVAVNLALEHADRLFKSSKARPQAKKVLVVMTDNASGRTAQVIFFSLV